MKEKSFLAPSKLKAAILYVLMLLIGSTLLSIIFGAIVASAQGLDVGAVVGSFFTTEVLNDGLLEARTEALGYATALSYLISALGVGFYMRNYLVEDFIKIKNNKVRYAIVIPAFAIVFTAIAIGIDILFSKITEDSNNQNTIVSILKTHAAVPMIIATVLFAPFVEELIYRKAIFEALKNYSIIPCYVASMFAFALPHMLSQAPSIGIWILQFIPYFLLGGMLCFVYHINKHNVYVSIAAHMLNNLMAVILVFF